MTNNEVVIGVLKSKKYKDIEPEIINKITISLSYKVSDRKLIDEVKAKLHQIWGSYYTTRPDFKKLLDKYNKGELSANQILSIHQSSKERIGEYDDIFNFIFNNTQHTSILDVGSGFNPLFVSNLAGFDDYTAIDIDIAQQDFLKEVLKNDKRITISIGNAESDLKEHDLVLALKLLPVLDQIKTNGSTEFISRLKCKYLVVSFPNRSISGKNKGMLENYREKYIPSIQNSGFSLIQEKIFKSETVYIFHSQ